MNKTNRLVELDSLRGIAALAVVLYHYTTRYGEIFGHKNSSYLTFDYGYLGVNLFFIISGFVIYMTLTKTPNVGDFAKKRAIRLYPAYIVAVILTFIAVSAYGLDGRGVPWIDALINITMLQGFIPGVENVDGVYWSLKAELTFYVMIGFFFYFRLTRKVLSFLILGIVGLVGLYLISSSIHLFVAGIMFYLIKENAQKKYYAVLIACLAYQFMFNSFIDSVVVTLFFLTFYGLIKGKMKFLKLKPLIFLGTISFSLYLVHQNIGYIVINELESNGFTNEAFVLIPILLSFALASLITFYIERPIQRLLLKKLHRNKEILASEIAA